MLVTILIWANMIWVLAGWGMGLSRLLGRWTNGSLSLAETLLWGLAGVTTAAAFLSLFVPTGLLTAAVLAAGGLAALWASRRERQGRLASGRSSALAAALGLVTLALVLNAATLPPTNPDTGIYHAQAVRWIESYPAVPGLGNFHTRLAYNSNWLVATAAFSLAFLGGQSFHLASSVLFLTAGLYFLEGLNDFLKGRVTPPGLLKTAFFPLATYLLAGDISSPSPDLAAALLVWACFILYLEIVFGLSQAAGKRDVLLAVLAALAVTVKLSSLPVLLLPALRLWGQNRRAAAVMLCAGGLVLAPWLARNVILSGYPVFPGLALDLFHADWRVPPEIVRAERLGIGSYARLPRLPGSEVQAMTLREWAVQWFSNLTPNRQAAFLTALGSPALVLLSLAEGWAARRRRDTLWRSTLRAAPAWAAAWVGVLFWFLTAPALRFGYGFLAAAPLLAVLPLLYAGMFDLGGRIRRVGILAVLLLAAYQVAALAQSLDAATLSKRLVLPADYTNLPTEPCRTGHLAVFCPSQWQDCGYAAFPCTPVLNPDVEMRGKDWADGFRSLDLPP